MDPSRLFLNFAARAVRFRKKKAASAVLEGEGGFAISHFVVNDGNRRDKDCLEDLPVYFTETEQAKIERALTVKAKSVEVLNVFLEVEPIPFNRGFYSVDMTFYFLVRLSAYYTPVSTADTVRGIAIFSKKVILYGSEGSVKVYDSETGFGEVNRATNSPRAVVQVVDPICLHSRLAEGNECDCVSEINFPNNIASLFEGSFVSGSCRHVLITLGLFTIVQLERPVQMLIPAYDFCVPGKECVTTTDDPCEVFKHIKFPTNEFFPPRLENADTSGNCNYNCACNSNT